MVNEGKQPDVEMKDANKKPTELKLSPPKAFSGKRDELEDFVQDVQMYLDINEETYDTDKKKIGYMLSFMNDGDAKTWKTAFRRSVTTNGVIDLGTWTNFLKKVNDSFKPYDAPGDALEDLLELKRGNSSIDDHISRFRIILERSEVPTTSPSAINYFWKSLNPPLQKELLRLHTPPTDLEDWYKWASKLDNNYRKFQRMIGRDSNNPNDKKKEDSKKKWNFHKKEKDPNAMDTSLGALTIEQRTEMMKKGLCFGCGKHGHLSKDCPDKKKPATPSTPIASSSSPPSYSPPKKMNAKELYTHIRSLTALMNEEEKEEFYDEAEKEGF
jgi:hypothetical protein